ncbi:leukocyte immunoglobulin-like receptor subfamily B member 2 [Sarcophilus harrisii]|uniref:leukocyte immunoglobulin-like receptor subfamily B member 2 n=1 Tax=Sarcophilus harrisii TaxID=9305 RepID=UPI001301F048|nr:leukocyte immunoglobulin-like receptor subfamily B member 2 [Sarcophilus harrisii]
MHTHAHFTDGKRRPLQVLKLRTGCLVSNWRIHNREDGETELDAQSGLSKKNASILLGVSALLILLFLFLLLFCCRRHRARISNGSRGAEVKKTSKSSYSASIPTEETLYIAVEDGRQTEEATQEDTAVPKGEDPQQVTYAQLNLCSLRAGTNNSPSSKPVEPSLYATLR